MDGSNSMCSIHVSISWIGITKTRRFSMDQNAHIIHVWYTQLPNWPKWPKFGRFSKFCPTDPFLVKMSKGNPKPVPLELVLIIQPNPSFCLFCKFSNLQKQNIKKRCLSPIYTEVFQYITCVPELSQIFQSFIYVQKFFYVSVRMLLLCGRYIFFITFFSFSFCLLWYMHDNNS